MIVHVLRVDGQRAAELRAFEDKAAAFAYLESVAQGDSGD